MKGKDKCKILKEIRAQIAAANEIAWVTEECPHKGDCRGTCPKCEAEVRQLERELERRRALGKSIAVVGLSVGLIATTTACAALDDLGLPLPAGKMPAPGGLTTTAAVTTTLPLTGDVDIAGVPMPPATTDEIPELGGEPVPVYYLTDFELYDGVRQFLVNQGFNLYDVVEGDEGPSGVWGSAKEGELFTLLGHNGTDQHEAYIYLIRYQDELYAIDVYDLEHFAEEIIAAEDGAKE